MSLYEYRMIFFPQLKNLAELSKRAKDPSAAWDLKNMYTSKTLHRGRKMSPKERSCYAGHWEMWQKIAAENDEDFGQGPGTVKKWYFISEDDTRWPKDIKSWADKAFAPSDKLVPTRSNRALPVGAEILNFMPKSAFIQWNRMGGPEIWIPLKNEYNPYNGDP